MADIELKILFMITADSEFQAAFSTCSMISGTPVFCATSKIVADVFRWRSFMFSLGCLQCSASCFRNMCGKQYTAGGWFSDFASNSPGQKLRSETIVPCQSMDLSRTNRITQTQRLIIVVTISIPKWGTLNFETTPCAVEGHLGFGTAPCFRWRPGPKFGNRLWPGNESSLATCNFFDRWQ